MQSSPKAPCYFWHATRTHVCIAACVLTIWPTDSRKYEDTNSNLSYNQDQSVVSTTGRCVSVQIWAVWLEHAAAGRDAWRHHRRSDSCLRVQWFKRGASPSLAGKSRCLSSAGADLRGGSSRDDVSAQKQVCSSNVSIINITVFFCHLTTQFTHYNFGQ